jgi:hypothetical protein
LTSVSTMNLVKRVVTGSEFSLTFDPQSIPTLSSESQCNG